MPVEFKEVVVHVLDEQERPFGNKDVLRIVKWLDGVPRLEKRSLYKTKEGIYRNGKAKGLTKEDLKLIFSQEETVKKFMEMA